MTGDVVRRRVTVRRGDASETREDRLAVEEPLEIRVGDRSLTVVMRTPGDDVELATGLLFTEGIVHGHDEIGTIAHCEDPDHPDLQNVIAARLMPGVAVDWDKLKRAFFTNTSCGLCGKTTIESIRQDVDPLPDSPEGAEPLDPAVLVGLPETLRSRQSAFEATGGLHACGQFDHAGNLVRVREDVGRHNAVDKVIGAAFLEGEVPLDETVLMVSGRASFEIVQKAAVARVPVICAVSAASSLAVDLAAELNVTLVGFLRDGSFTVYCGADRIATKG